MLFFGLCWKRGGRARYLLGARRQGKKVLGGAVGMLLNLDRVCPAKSPGPHQKPHALLGKQSILTVVHDSQCCYLFGRGFCLAGRCWGCSGGSANKAKLYMTAKGNPLEAGKVMGAPEFLGTPFIGCITVGGNTLFRGLL